MNVELIIKLATVISLVTVFIFRRYVLYDATVDDIKQSMKW